MQKFVFFLSLFLSAMNCHLLPAKDYLANRISSADQRAPTFQACFQLLEARNAKVLVETGTARLGAKNCAGDGCSTILFADWAKDHNATLYSVDICPVAIRKSQKAVRRINRNVQFFTQDSVGFLQNFRQKIDLLYLDSYDFDYDNPTPSQVHHLREIDAALPFLHKDSVIMIDDCALPHGGKGKLVIEYLTSLGWEVFLAGYQVIMVYPPQQQEIDLSYIDLNNYEKRIFSQNGEDGVLSKIFEVIGTSSKFFVEFGVQDGEECNTRYLRENDHWQGLMMDAGYYTPEINLQKEMITAENVNDLFSKYHVPKEFDLLSIDIDFNDFYVLRSLLENYSPRVIVAEYNSTHFHNEDKVVIYDPTTFWDGTNYFGASILSLFNLGRKYHYSLIYSERGGINLFFVRDDVLKSSGASFKNANSVAKIYKFPKYGTGPKGGHIPDPLNRPYTSSEILLGNKSN
jgi:hypothetical protein